LNPFFAGFITAFLKGLLPDFGSGIEDVRLNNFDLKMDFDLADKSSISNPYFTVQSVL